MRAPESRYLWNLMKRVRRKMPICCYFCKGKRSLTIHHILPRSHGGLDDVDNLSLLCRMCHDRLHEGKPADYKTYFYRKMHPDIRKRLVRIRKEERRQLRALTL